MKKLTVFLVACFFTLKIFGNDLQRSHTSNRSAYVADLVNDIDLTSAYKLDFMHFAMIDDKRKQQFGYYPNLRGVVSLGARYKFLRLSYSFDILANDTYNKHYGKTSFSDFRFGFKTRSFWMDFYYEKYEGFYISESQKFFPNFALDSIYQRNSDLSTFRLGFDIDILQDSRFSKEAAFNYTEIQKKSAGSLIFHINNQLSNINAGNSKLVPANYYDGYSDLYDFNRVRFLSFIFGVGYGHALVLGPLNFSNAIVAGPNMQMYFFDGFRIRIPYSASFKSSLSINTPHFYTGVMTQASLNNHYFKDNVIRRQGLVFLLRAGFRFA